MANMVNGSSSTNKLEAFLTTYFAIIIPLILMLFMFFFKNSKKSSKRIAPLPPGPRGLPVVGYLPFLSDNLHKKFMELAEIYGPIFKLQLGSKLCMVISSPSLVKEIVRDQDTIFANRDPPIVAKVTSYGCKDIAWSEYNSGWKKMRKIFVREIMSNTSLDACYRLQKQVVEKAIKEVHDKKIGKQVDIGELSFLVNLNAIMNIIWGDTLEGEEGIEERKEFRKLVGDIMVFSGKPNISDYFPLLAKFDLQGVEKHAKKYLEASERFFDLAIRRCQGLIEVNKLGGEDERTKKKDLLSLLLELKDGKDEANSFSMTELMGMLQDIIIGGSDTTSTMVEWTIAELMHHPEKMQKVQQELERVVGLNNTVGEFHLPKLPYLYAVVKETFRLHPAKPLLFPRRASSTTTVGGYTIPKGTTIFLNMYAIQMDPRNWEDPQEFKPERFLDDGVLEGERFDFSGNSFNFLPFGSGRRICAGLPLAERMLIFQLASLLHCFEWKLPAGTKMDFSDKFGIVVKKMKPLIGIPTPRLMSSNLY